MRGCGGNKLSQPSWMCVWGDGADMVSESDIALERYWKELNSFPTGNSSKLWKES